MDSDDLSSMYGQIVRGVTKEDSRFVTDDESSALWDTIAAEVEAMRAENPQVVFDVPNEFPGEAPDAVSGETPEEPPEGEKPPEEPPAEEPAKDEADE